MNPLDFLMRYGLRQVGQQNEEEQAPPPPPPAPVSTVAPQPPPRPGPVGIGSQFMPQRAMAPGNSMQDPTVQAFLRELSVVPGAKLPDMGTVAPQLAAPTAPPSPRKAAASTKRAKRGSSGNQSDSTALLNSLALELAKGSIDYNQFMAALEKERATRGTANRTYQGLLEGV